MKTKIWIALIALYVVWGSTYLGIRFSIETIPPFIMAGTRFFISGLILVFSQRAIGSAWPTRKQWLAAAIIGNLLLLGGNGMLGWAEQTIPSGIAALIVGSIPMFMVILEAIRPNGIKPNWQSTIGLLIGFAGIFVLIGPGKVTGNHQSLNPLGLGALLITCLTWSAGSVYAKAADLPNSTLMATGAQMLMGCLGLFIVGFLTGEFHDWNVVEVSAKSMLGLTYLILVGSLVGFVSYGWLLKNAPISLVATYAYVNPIVAILLGNWFANETLAPRIWLASVIIIGAVVFINGARRPRVKQKAVLASTD